MGAPARRARLPRWFGLASGAVDMTLVTAALAGFCLAGQPFTATNSGVTFELRARTGEPVAAVLLDVDHFKLVNDRHGHATGDAVLRAVAATLRAHARESDVLSRHGGEEFALLLPGATGEAALARAEALRSAVGAMRVSVGPAIGGAEPLGVTASAGVACTEEAGLGDAVGLMHRADQRLYQAKREGRDRVVGAGGHRA